MNLLNFYSTLPDRKQRMVASLPFELGAAFIHYEYSCYKDWEQHERGGTVRTEESTTSIDIALNLVTGYMEKPLFVFPHPSHVQLCDAKDLFTKNLGFAIRENKNLYTSNKCLQLAAEILINKRNSKIDLP